MHRSNDAAQIMYHGSQKRSEIGSCTVLKLRGEAASSSCTIGRLVESSENGGPPSVCLPNPRGFFYGTGTGTGSTTWPRAQRGPSTYRKLYLRSTIHGIVSTCLTTCRLWSIKLD